jgi:hypothetical protein
MVNDRLSRLAMIRTFAVVCLWAACTGAVAQTATNGCTPTAGNEYSVTLGTTCTWQTFNKPASFTNTLQPGGCSSGNYGDAWGWFTAVHTTTTITFDPANSHRPILHVFTGTCGGTITQVACNDAGADGANATVTISSAPGTVYLIRVQRRNSNSEMNGSICILSPRSTDACSLSATGMFAVSNSCQFQPFNKPEAYVANLNPGGCSSGNYDDAWGWFTATSSLTAITYDPDASVRPILHVFSGSCASLTQIGCNDAGANGQNAVVVVNTVPGQNYYFRVQRHSSNSAMDGAVCIQNVAPPDECGQAQFLPTLNTCFMQTFSNADAVRSAQAPNPSCGGTINNGTMFDLWFTFTAPPNGRVVIETQAGTMGNAAMQLYSGTCSALTAIECDDDDGPGNMPMIDRACNPLVPGNTYYIRVWGKSGQRGTFGICVREVPSRQEDCVGAQVVCGDAAINNNATTNGCTQDLGSGNRGCLASNERQGTWYYFSPSASGTVEFTITPNGNVDYDFAIWGPLSDFSCPPVGTPIRCSYAYPPSAGTWLTGLRAGNSDVSEAASGTGVNGFVAPMSVVVGQVYILYVDNFDVTGQSFTLDWNLTDGCSLDCTVLPVELFGFEAVQVGGHVELRWSTASETGSSHFVVEHGLDPLLYEPIAVLPAIGGALGTTNYRATHTSPHTGVNYYRLKQVDTDGSVHYSEIVAVTFTSGPHILLPRPNPTNSHVQAELPEGMTAGFSIAIADAAGRIVRTLPGFGNGDATVNVDVADLEAGSYTLLLVSGAGELAGVGRFIRE